MTKSIDDVPDATATPGTNSIEANAAQSGAPGRGRIGLLATSLVHLAGMRTRVSLTLSPLRRDGAEGARGRLTVNPAPATDLPSRRALLSIFIGASTNPSFPTQAGIAGPVARGDADLIALAMRTAALAADVRNAVAGLVAADTRFDKLAPPRPSPPVGNDTRTIAGFTAAVPPHGGKAIHGTLTTTAMGTGTVGLGHEADVAAWEAMCATVERRCGRRAALRKYGRTSRRLVSAAAALAGSKATSREAALAKARACVLLSDPHHSCDPPEWLSELLSSAVRDVVAADR